jgi:TldD protein
VGAEAVEIARASAKSLNQPATLSPRPAVVAEWASPCVEDPFTVPVASKVALLMEADAKMAAQTRLAVRESMVGCTRTGQLYMDTEGARIFQTKTESGAGLEAIAAEAGEMQQRSYPQFEGDWMQAGWEYVSAMDLPGNAARVGREAVELLDAPDCPSGVRTLILRDSMLALQLHESCGHPVELDRVLGMEAGFAGTSFLTTEKLGRFKYGSPYVNITADATIPGALGSFGYDDEGVAARCEQIVKAGLFVGYLSSRETAPVVGRDSMGAVRGDGWNRLPMIRMTNVNLLPGDSSLAELIAGTEKGIVVDGVRSWSIDDHRLDFQFACQYGQLIENGQLDTVVKNTTYAGRTPDFWGSCDGVAGPSEWRVWGVANCGKGEPMQEGHVGHGVSAARFRNVRVGVGNE